MRQIVTNPKDRPEIIDPGSAPMLQWLRIDRLVVDDSYQRQLYRENWTAIRRIAAKFKWSRFSPVFVAPIEGGFYAIIDGQHRTHAAAICGFAEVPCQIVQMNREEQAASFAAVNGLVTQVRPGQIFKAALTAGEPWAIDCDRAVASAGCRLMTQNATTKDKKAGDIYALALVKGLVKAGKGGLLTVALTALRKSESGDIADYWTGPMLKAWTSAVTSRPVLIGQEAALTAFLNKIDLWEIMDKAEEEAKRKRRLGFAVVTRFDLAEAALGDALDRRFAKAAAA